MPTTFYLWYILACYRQFVNPQIVGNLHPGTTDILKFKDKLDALLDGGSGVNILSEKLRKQVEFVKETSFDPVKTAEEIAEKVQFELDKRKEAVNQLRDVVRSLHFSGAFVTEDETRYTIWNTVLNLEECCSLEFTELTYNYRFQAYVDFDRYCYLTAHDTTDKPEFPLHSRLLQVFQNNRLLLNETGYQYIGTHDGITVVYPAVIPPSCFSQAQQSYFSFFSSYFFGKSKLTFSPKERPWYNAAFNKFSKDVVIVADCSEKMAKLMYDEKVTVHRAALRMLNITVHLLTSSDRFGVVFSPTYELTENPIFTRQMVYATEDAKRQLYTFLDTVPTVGVSDYAKHFQAAVQVIKNSPPVFQQVKRRTMVVLLSGVVDKESDRYVMIRKVDEHMKKINYSAELVMIGVGKLTPIIANTMRTLVTDVKQPRRGAFYYVGILDKTDQIESELFDYFRQDDYAVTPVLSLPFKEAVSLDMVVSLSAVIDRGLSVYGVVGVDMELRQLETQFMGNTSHRELHAFLCDHVACNQINHPLLPIPESRTGQAAVGLPLATLDHGEDIQKVIDIVTSGKSGQVTAQSSLPFSTGMPRREAVHYDDVKCKYVINPVKDYPISVVFVLPEGKEAPVQAVVSKGLPLVFKYHFESGTEKDVEHCQVFYTKAVIDSSVVKFAPKAFYAPFRYMSEEDLDPQKKALEIEDAVTGEEKSVWISADPIKPGAISDVYLSGLVNGLWVKNGELDIRKTPAVVLRFVGTENGVFRYHPGVQYPQIDFDPTTEDWYLRAARSPEDVSISTPRIDVSQNDFSIAITKAILYPNTSTVWGVAGIDVTLSLMENLLMNIDFCQRSAYECLIVDKAGFIVYHKSWVHATWTGEPKVQGVHIMEMEGILGKKMIANKHMKAKACWRAAEGRMQMNYEIVTDFADALLSPVGYYKLDKVPNTNIYVLVINKIASFGSADCACRELQTKMDKTYAESDGRTFTVFDEDPTNIPACPNTYKTTCYCPCLAPFESKIVFLGNASRSDDNITDICEPPPQRPRFVDPDYDGEYDYTPPSLPWCVPAVCDEKKTIEECQQYSMCRWCDMNTDGSRLDTPFCSSFSACFFGQLDRTLLKSYTPSWFDSVPYIVGPVAAIVVIIGIAMASFAGYKKYQKDELERKEEEERKIEWFKEWKIARCNELAERRREWEINRLRTFIVKHGGDFDALSQTTIDKLLIGEIKFKKPKKRRPKRARERWKQALFKLTLKQAIERPQERRVGLLALVAMNKDTLEAKSQVQQPKRNKRDKSKGERSELSLRKKSKRLGASNTASNETLSDQPQKQKRTRLDIGQEATPEPSSLAFSLSDQKGSKLNPSEVNPSNLIITEPSKDKMSRNVSDAQNLHYGKVHEPETDEDSALAEAVEVEDSTATETASEAEG